MRPARRPEGPSSTEEHGVTPTRYASLVVPVLVLLARLPASRAAGRHEREVVGDVPLRVLVARLVDVLLRVALESLLVLRLRRPRGVADPPAVEEVRIERVVDAEVGAVAVADRSVRV